MHDTLTLAHLNFLTGLVGTASALILFVVIGVAVIGQVRQSLLHSMRETIDCYRIELDQVKAEMGALKEKMTKMEKDGRMKTAQLGMALRVIEYFERVVTVYAKRRTALPAPFVAQMDAAIKELAEFRERATLDLESQEINQDFYEWIVARATISGPELFGARATGEQERAIEPT